MMYKICKVLITKTNDATKHRFLLPPNDFFNHFHIYHRLGKTLKLFDIIPEYNTDTFLISSFSLIAPLIYLIKFIRFSMKFNQFLQ